MPSFVVKKVAVQKTISLAPTPSPLADISAVGDKLSQSPDGLGQLPIDILENEKEILVIAPIAGVDIDATDIIITNDVLTIRGERQTDLSEFNFKKRDYYVQECFWGKFSRSIILPPNADAQRIEATQKDRVLYIRIPKKTGIQMRIVKIK